MIWEVLVMTGNEKGKAPAYRQPLSEKQRVNLALLLLKLEFRKIKAVSA
jgi:hypothetical protein